MEKKISLLLEHFHEIFFLKPVDFGKFSHASGIQNAPLIHRQGWKG